MWDIFWIKRAACTTKDLYDVPASIYHPRTSYQHHNILILQDIIMCQTWTRTLNLQEHGELLMVHQGRTGAHIVWDPLTLFRHPWAILPRDKFPIAQLITIPCTLQDQLFYLHQQKIYLRPSFLQTERNAIPISGWAKLFSRLQQVKQEQKRNIGWCILIIRGLNWKRNFILTVTSPSDERLSWRWALDFQSDRLRSGSKIAEPRSESWSKRKWASLTAAEGQYIVTQDQWALYLCLGLWVRRIYTVHSIRPQEWTHYHRWGAYSKLLLHSKFELGIIQFNRALRTLKGQCAWLSLCGPHGL